MDKNGKKYFRGSSFHTIDAKGRIVIPTRFRTVLETEGGDGVIVTTMDDGLFAYTYSQWEEIEEKVLRLHETTETMRRFRRIFIGGASDCKCDGQGRILIPPMLRKNAKLEKDITKIVTHLAIDEVDYTKNVKKK